ncbi:precorrin-6A/cobalt-precorrin-6A reductase [Aureibacter tunicatorum]|uniref:Precorrin-6A/cobalt-precorrin-6A reductase n=1 Tax=Aureibacter tunicatorum TaxID=866807 RepID=A0AAE4BP45_9BACT|nr:precorrin-6A/cobalt-precorrin-6A reductase [Aureibacter tunicatorum]MDR6237549.1 precorrin-6A/cobalt-precorrin-6A reductase [Aureibacter tunicatorum]BDD02583.1 hypothetical protein AUTU_00660 [Aureibacter tunicatorum]
MILVFGGTTEGLKVADLLEQSAISFVYSTKTKVEIADRQGMLYRFGAFDLESLSEYIAENMIELIIDASHPFAVELHDLLAEFSQSNPVKLIRLERKFPPRLSDEKITYVNDTNEALALLNSRYQGKTLVSFTGVQSIVKLKEFWENNVSYFRILNRKSSMSLAEAVSFPIENLITTAMSKLACEEKELLKRHKAQVVLLKESGESGAFMTKIEAVKSLGLECIVIKKPELPQAYQQVFSWEELKMIFEGKEELWA